MELFKLEPGLAVWTWITFGILFVILWKLVLPVLLKNLQSREEYIASAVDNAEKVEARLQEINTERAEIIKKAENEADSILHRTRDEAEQLRIVITSYSIHYTKLYDSRSRAPRTICSSSIPAERPACRRA